MRWLSITVGCLCSIFSIFADEKAMLKDGSFDAEIIESTTIKDEKRNKELTFKASYPKKSGSYPVVLFSHGFGGNKDAFGPITKHWASHGYIVLQPSHADGLRKGKIEKGGLEPIAQVEPKTFPGLQKALGDPKKIADRVADLVALIDSLGTLPKQLPGLKDKIDAKKIAVAGHSFGAYTTMLIGGVTADLDGKKDRSFADPRVQCIIPISAQGTGQQGLTEKSWQALKLPMLTITGTRDTGVGGQSVDWRKEPYKFSPNGDKYLSVIDGANHLSFGGTGGRNTDITDVVKLTTTHFLNAYVKGDEAAKKYLQSDKIVTDVNNKHTFDKK